MELIERYIHEIGRRLPAKTRNDVQQELRSLLNESLQERLENGGSPDEVAAQLLIEFGPPDQVAARYQTGPNYLIGPEQYPIYLNTLKIVLGILGIVMATLFGVGIFAAPERVLNPSSVISAIWGYAQMAALHVGIVTLIFALIERSPSRAAQAKPTTFDPQKLPPVEDKDRPSIPGLVAGIYFTFILLVIFNFYPQYFGIVFFKDNTLYAVPLQALGLRFPETLVNICWILTIVLNVMVLRARHWTRETRWAEVGVSVLSAITAARILAMSQSPTITDDWFSGLNLPPELAQMAPSTLAVIAKSVYIGVAFVLFITVLDTAGKVYRVLRAQTGSRSAANSFQPRTQ